jgi:hypothetical protein
VTDIDRALIAFYGRPFRFPSGDYHRMGAALAADRHALAIREPAPTRDAYDKACAALWRHRAENERLRAALTNVANVLGPDICDCEPARAECGLRDEATEALRGAREALAGDA